MATSAIRYSGNEVFVKDIQLGEWIKAITKQFDGMIANGKDIKWLLNSCNDWCDIYENLPPGLKDIELDEMLEKEGRKEEFINLLKSTASLESSNDFDLDIAKEVSANVLTRLFVIN